MAIIGKGISDTYVIITIIGIIIVIALITNQATLEKKCIEDYNNGIVLEEGSDCKGYYLKEIKDKEQLEEINRKVLNN